MFLYRYGAFGAEQPGIFINDVYYTLPGFNEDYNEAFFATNGLERLKNYIALNSNNLPVLPSDTRIGSPVARPSKIVCIGLNYSDHAIETNATPPSEPVVFLKSTTAMCGPFDEIILPKDSIKTDWEVELAVVMGKKASYVSEEAAMEYVAGYCLHNDLSEREFQLERGGTWDKGKGCDSFGPMGPLLVTKDEIEDVHQLPLWLTINNTMMQNSNTNQLIFNIPFLIAYISRFMTLLPGDIISTGTPAGVGLGMKPNMYLKPGDVVSLGIQHLGTATQVVREYR